MENTNTEENFSYVVNISDKPNSYEFGKAGNRFKLYFNDVAELVAQIAELKAAGLYVEEVKDDTKPI